ncbi:MAG TPA: hypothetical protein VJN64_07615 [Terriglobales bacterium]|nr:hypothetical protein [Terriglobales bacterium]
MKFVLDEPWRVKILPQQEPERLPPGVLPKPEPLNPRQLPWRPGDVARLKDDTPEGMMKYIATHTTGWWQEMAQRALRDTERAQRRAEEAGVQHGQYWTLELDVETKERLRREEEARRARAEAEKAKEAAAREAFAQRQRELLEKAGRAPRCEYRYTDGRGCRAPQVRGERWCHGHAKMMSYRPEKLELVPLEDEQSVMVNLYRVTKSLASGRITEKMAGLMLWSVAIGARGSRVIARDRRNRRDRKSNSKIFETQNQDLLTTKDTKEHKVENQNRLTTEGTEEHREGEGQSQNRLATDATEKHGSERLHSGVTADKSFRFGVEHRGTQESPRAPGSHAIARDRKAKANTFETQRNTASPHETFAGDPGGVTGGSDNENAPQMNTEEHRSEKQGPSDAASILNSTDLHNGTQVARQEMANIMESRPIHD